MEAQKNIKTNTKTETRKSERRKRYKTFSGGKRDVWCIFVLFTFNNHQILFYNFPRFILKVRVIEGKTEHCWFISHGHSGLRLGHTEQCAPFGFLYKWQGSIPLGYLGLPSPSHCKQGTGLKAEQLELESMAEDSGFTHCATTLAPLLSF